MQGVVTALIWSATFLVGPLLPRPLRPFWPWQTFLQRPGLQVGHASCHAVASVVAYMVALVWFVKDFADRTTEQFVQVQGNQDVPEGFLRNYGIIGFFVFLFSPLGLLCALYATDSILRFVDGVMHHSVPGSLFVAAPAFLFRKSIARAQEARLTRRYGPADAPDRVEVRGDALFLRATREREEWHPMLTFSFGGKLYRLRWHGEVPDGPRTCFEYRFGPWPEHDAIRRMVLLDPEGGGAGAASAAR